MPFKSIDLLAGDFTYSLRNRSVAAHHVECQADGGRVLDTLHNDLGNVLSGNTLAQVYLASGDLTRFFVCIEGAWSNNGVIELATAVLSDQVAISGQFGLAVDTNGSPHAVADSIVVVVVPVQSLVYSDR